MTTPSERFRALGFGAELLARLQAEDAVPAPLKSQASRLELVYPRHDQLRALLSQPNERLPHELAVAIFEAGMLFEATGKLSGMAADMRELWRTTMRHYPGRADSWSSPETLRTIAITELLGSDQQE